MTKQKLTKLLRHAYHWGRDNGSNRSEKNFNDFLQTEAVKQTLSIANIVGRKEQNEPYPVLAAGIITAVRDENWEEMLKIFSEGVEHRTWKYDCPKTFTEWESYEEYSRHIAPAREMMKKKCLNKALEYLNACS